MHGTVVPNLNSLCSFLIHRQAQRDLFSHTNGGDLRPLLSGFFDTSSGAKVDAASYKNIELSLGVESPQDVLFFTDNPAESSAAREAGWKVLLVQRPGNKELSPQDVNQNSIITSFEGLGNL